MALLDFDDLLLHTAAAIENDAAVAEEFRDRYRCFVVDEYQDVTPLQQRVLDAWLGERDDLTVVGDANQTIYSFTGATPRYLLDFSRRFPDAAVVRLERDYRSTPQVVSLANRVIAAARGRVAGSKLHLIGQRDPGPAPSFAEHPDEVAEAAAVAKKIKQLIETGTAASEIAVLYRINAQSEVYEEALTEAGVAFQVRGGEGFFSRQEIRQALLALQRAAERDVEASGARAARPLACARLLEPLGLTAEPPPGTRARERWEALTALAELVDEEVAQRPSLDLRALLAELRQRADARHPPVVQGVTLASLHAAKGLEWDAVFLVGLADGTLPISHALAHGPDSEPVEEERRLLYVGITRARVHLALSWALAGTGRPAEPAAVALPQRHRPAIAGRHPEPAATAARRDAALPRLQQHADHAGGDHAAPLRKLPVRHRRGAARRAQGLAAAHLQGDERARLCGVHRQHADRDRRDAADRRRRAGRDPRHRRAQARAVRPGRAGVGQRPPIVVKIVPKPQVRKSLVDSACYALASRSRE